MKMSGGNPGSMMTIISIYNGLQEHPEDFLMLLMMDTFGIYDEKIYMLFSDCCDKDMDKLRRVFHNLQQGELTKEDFLKHINGNGVRGIPFDI